MYTYLDTDLSRQTARKILFFLILLRQLEICTLSEYLLVLGITVFEIDAMHFS